MAVDRSLAKVRRIEALCALHGFSNVHCLATDSRHMCSEDAVACGSPAHGESAKPGTDADPADSTWPESAEQALLAALHAHGADRHRSEKRIWKAVKQACPDVGRLQVQARMRQMQPSGRWAQGSFDRILCDVPCSAMGQQPLLHWGKSVEEVRAHAEYQRHFLRTAARLLRPGGELVYSTCTLTTAENEENVAWALQALPELELLDARERALASRTREECLHGWPGCGLSEEERRCVLRFDPRHWDGGFFIALLRRRQP